MFIFSFSIFAGDKKGYTELKSGSVYYQRLEWESTGVVKEYQVIVEQKNDSTYTEIINIRTKENFYNVSLDYGQYRFKVIFYNVLGKKAFTTEYKEFSILVAYQPQISNKKVKAVNLEDDFFDGEFVLNANSITASAKFYLVPVNKKNNTEKIVPEKVEFNDNNVHLYFNKELLEKGNYVIVVTNPGGLSDTTGVFKIKGTKKHFFDISADYFCSCILYDDAIKTLAGNNILPVNLRSDFSYAYGITKKDKAGVELSAWVSNILNSNAYYTLCGYLVSGDLNILYERTLFSNNHYGVFIDGYAGGGINYLANLKAVYPDNSVSEPFNSFMINVDAGACVKVCFKNHTFVKAGVEFTSGIPLKNIDYNIGELNIFAGVGIRF